MSQIFDKFAETIRAASNEGLSTGEWAEPNGLLARIILFDQLSRNAFRKQPEAFKYDQECLVISRRYPLPSTFHAPPFNLVAGWLLKRAFSTRQVTSKPQTVKSESETLGRVVAEEGLLDKYPTFGIMFAGMPLMHSEKIEDHVSTGFRV
jgi:uncharacterized protein (DUF924 family)